MSGLTLMEQLNQMAADAEKMKQDASEKGLEIKRRAKNIRRKSRDLEQDFFGKFIEEVKDENLAFEKFDADGNGKISKSELKEALSNVKSITFPSDDVFGNMITKFADLRADDAPETAPCTELSKEAFKQLVTALKSKDIDQYTSSAEEEELKLMFAAADVDKSGTLEKSEIEVLFKSLPENVGKAVSFSPEQWKKIMAFGNDKEEFNFDAFAKLVGAIRKGAIM
mmetsp:Transcript_68451/g.135624  ORF Transcript_68451/g.135624 Transcript_68451/m.135624 type:complete len:225 (-) Transcript_68451:453-1127(-)